MYRIAVCDDEKIYRSRLKDLLEKYAQSKGLSFEILCFESADKLLLNYPRTSTSSFSTSPWTVWTACPPPAKYAAATLKCA